MTRRLPACVLACIVFFAGCSHRGGVPPPPSSPAASTSEIPPGVEQAYTALASRFDRESAFAVVTFMDRYWRVAGNPGFNASIDHIRGRLNRAGFVDAATAGAPGTVRVDEFPNGGQGWDYRVGTLAFDDAPQPAVLSRDRDRVSLAINSFSTVPGGLRVPLIDVGRGAEADYAARDVKGALVLGDAALGRLWQEAVKKRGAAGVVSTEIAGYVRPAAPPMTPDEQDVLQWGSIPYDTAVKGFGFKASYRAAARMRERLRQGPVTMRVDIESSFYDGPNRTLVAEIPGRSKPAERIVMVAHIQEPGANDDASGCATLYGLARALMEAIRSGALPQPERTLTFMWVDEIRGSRQWITSHPEDARNVQYMLSMDMTGEDTVKTGGTFLIEKQADPSAVWPRPSDPHSEWGAGEVSAESLKGSLLNDVHISVCNRRARETGWVLRTNPYEGGSDHTAFAAAGVPSLLNWHFTDRFYHTSQDTPDKTSAAEMEHVGISVATTAWFLASASERDALAAAGMLEAAATRRLALERRQGVAIVAAASNKTEADALEGRIQAAWVKWYGEALDSVLRLPPAGASDRLRDRVARAKENIQRVPRQ